MEFDKSASALGTAFDALAIGGGAAAAIALIRQYIEAKRQKKREEARMKTDIDPDTVVLRIPPSRLSSKLAEDGSGHVKVNVVPAVQTKEVRPLSEGQLREVSGRFAADVAKEVPDARSEKVAGSDQSIVGGAGDILTAGGGVVAGFYIVSKLAERLEQNRLKKQIAAAQTEYLDLLDGKNVKNAEAFSELFMFDRTSNADPMSKEAGIPTDLVNLISSTPKRIRQTGSAALAAYILAAGGTAYVVKKYLEDRFGKRDEQEEPERKTRILFKAGSSEFDIGPDNMLATVGILRDCILDSTPPGYKQASGYDYSFLDRISRMRGGNQWILDAYAKQQGLNRDGLQEIKLPLSTRIKYSKTLKDVVRNPDRHALALQGYVMDMMRKDPQTWFELLGQPRNSDLVRFKADERIRHMSDGGGVSGAISGIPVLGDAIKGLASWYSSSTESGRNATGKGVLQALGLPEDAASHIADSYDFSTPGRWSRKTTKSASFDDSLIAFLSRRKTLTDASNRDVIKAINDLKSSRRRKKNKDHDKPGVSVEFDDSLDGLLSEEDKKKIVSGITRGR